MNSSPPRPLPHLPVDDHLKAILDVLAERRSVVVVAEPGAGKTSRVPPAIVADRRLVKPGSHAIMLQPRRTAARSAAEWIGYERGWEIGREVGYQVRFENRTSPATRLRVVTEGILTRRLLADPELNGCDVAILDEFHERSLDADLALMFLAEAQAALRPDLGIVVMSATIDARRIADYLGGCPIVEVPGRTFPVAVDYAQSAAHLPLPARIAREVEKVFGETTSGDVLVFLPGMREIREVDRQLRDLAGSGSIKDADVRVLHGSLPIDEQMRVLKPGPRRRVILSTNVAETSLTIEGIACVIDSGLVRQAGFDDANGFDTLRTRRISAASAQQRSGRAGRTGPGRCVRVWSPQESLEPYDLAEIERLDLAGLVLACAGWGWAKLSDVRWISPPPQDRLDAAVKTLHDLGAIEKGTDRLSPMGHVLNALPVHPRLGRVLVEAARFGLEREGARIVALISERDFLTDDAAKRLAARHGIKSDVLLRSDVMEGAISCEDSGCDREALRRVRQVSDQLGRAIRSVRYAAPSLELPPECAEDEARLAYLLMSGFSDRVCRRSKRGAATAFMARGLGVRSAPASLERESEFFLALDPRREENSTFGSEPVVRIAIGLKKEWIESWLADRILTEKTLKFDDATGKARWTFRKRLHELVLSEGESPVSPEEQAAAFAEHAGRHAEEWLRQAAGVGSWLARYRLLIQAMPEKNWPTEPDWAEAARGWAAGCKSREQLRGRPALSWIQTTLPTEAVRLVAEELPESLTLPNGRTAQIDYENDAGHPLIAARVQDFFGWKKSPRLALGRVSILMEILAPNQRPVQRTLDLESFWSNTYPQVRKDLRGRYPKHHWPEDPWSAEAGPSIRRKPES